MCVNTFGKLFRISIFGESHGSCIGCTIDGLPAGFKPDLESVRNELMLRAPRSGIESTSRRETDDFRILSGFYSDRCTGMPMTAVFCNTDARSGDYPPALARPSHADYAAHEKFKGFNDPRGGGAFSGRMTAALVFAGALARQLLEGLDIHIVSHIKRIGKVEDAPFDPLMKEVPKLDRRFPLIDSGIKSDFECELAHVRSCGDSVGGSVETAVLGMPVGVGEPFFDSIESVISHIVFSVPGVHGISFGEGFRFAAARGSAMNDSYAVGGSTVTNHSGGINGGLSNGMPLIFEVCFRPIPSIFTEQDMLDLETKSTFKGQVKGRHDACILPRGCVVIEACAAIALYDLILQYNLYGGKTE